MINEHDLTKKMINDIRSKKFLLEAEEGNDVITPAENSDVYKSELQKIGDTVDKRVQITKFKIYPKDRDVQVDGRFDQGINFYFSTKAGKPSISMTDEAGNVRQMFVDDDIVEIINKLSGYYENWSEEWAEKLNTEYKAK